MAKPHDMGDVMKARTLLLVLLCWFIGGCNGCKELFEEPPPKCTEHMVKKMTLPISRVGEFQSTIQRKEGKPLETVGGAVAGALILGGPVGAGVGALVGHESTGEVTTSNSACIFRVEVEGILLSYYSDDHGDDDYQKCRALLTGDTVEVTIRRWCWRDTGYAEPKYFWKSGTVGGKLY